MSNSLGLFAVCLALCLTSCVGETSSSIASSVPNVSSSERVPSSALSSSAKPSVQASSSTEKSSSEKPLLSSSAAVHYTVSIYQSYYIEEKGEYGNPRFDTSVTREAGQPLYANISEKHDLMDLCTEVFRPTGGDGIYDFRAFFEDKRCRTAIGYKYYITSDVSIFYYCE